MEKISSFGIKFIFHDNYLEITNKLGFGGFLFPKKVTIAYKNIASVDVNKATGRLSIETTGGRIYKYRTGIFAGIIREKILSKV